MNKNRKAKLAALALVGAVSVSSAAALSVEASPASNYSPLAGAVASMYTPVIPAPAASTTDAVLGGTSVFSGSELAVSNLLAEIGQSAQKRAELYNTIGAGKVQFGEFDNVGIAKVADYVNIRQLPTEDSPVAGKLYGLGACTILGYEGDWARVTSGDVAEGYILKDFLAIGNVELCLAHSTVYAVSKVDGLNVREGMDLTSRVVERINAGDMLEVVGDETTGPWIKVTTSEEEGYVSADYVDINRIFNGKAESVEAERARIAREQAIAESIRRAAEERAAQANRPANTGGSSNRTSTPSAPARSYAPPAGSNGSSVANYGLQFVGNPYRYGGTSLTNGTDCSGFVMSVYQQFGVNLPHSSSSLRSVGYGVGQGDMQPGDIVCYSGHVGIAIGGGQIVHASNRRDGIKVSSAHYRNILAVRRIF